MGRFERGLAKVEQRDLEQQFAIDDPMAALREIVAEHRAQQTPFQRFISDKLHDHITDLMVNGSTSISTPPLSLDELAAMDGLT